MRRFRSLPFTIMLAPRAEGVCEASSVTCQGSPSISSMSPRFRSVTLTAILSRVRLPPGYSHERDDSAVGAVGSAWV